jgi:hypothetical protein
MGRIAGQPNKITLEVKSKLQDVIDGIVDSIDIDTMTTEQKLKYLQISIQYVIPRLKAVYTEKVKDEDLPLFID